MKTDHGCGCHSVGVSCEEGLAERPRYFPRQLITPDDLTLEQEYFRNRMRRHNRLLHGWGVVCGALVCPVIRSDGAGETTPWKVVVQPGYILGPYGDEIILDCNICFDLRTRCVTGVTGEACGESVDPWCSEVYVRPERDAPLYVAVRYKPAMARPVRVQPLGCGCDDSQCEYSRWRDGYEICVLDHCPDTKDTPTVELGGGDAVPSCPECPTEPWVVLASVTVDRAGVIQSIDNCVCRRMVVSLGTRWWQCTTKVPLVPTVNPTEVKPGDKNAEVRLEGSNLDPKAEVSLGSGIEVVSVKAPVTNGTALTVTVNVADAARPGPRNIVVRNPDCSTATLAGRFSVAAAKPEPPPRRKAPAKTNP